MHLKNLPEPLSFRRRLFWKSCVYVCIYIYIYIIIYTTDCFFVIYHSFEVRGVTWYECIQSTKSGIGDFCTNWKTIVSLETFLVLKSFSWNGEQILNLTGLCSGGLTSYDVPQGPILADLYFWFILMTC